MMTYKKGSRGEVIKKIQQALHLYPDGIFGVVTEEAVKGFQAKNGLKVDGIVGIATLTKLGILMVQQHFNLKKSSRAITELIVHCSATPEGKDYTVEDIRRWHKQQGWSNIGYHYVVYRNGEVVPGRDVDIVGAHCYGHNRNSIGICYIGGVTNNPGTATYKQLPKDTRTPAQKESLLNLLTDLKRLYPKANIYGHRDFEKGKACPSFDAKNEYKNLKVEL